MQLYPCVPAAIPQTMWFLRGPTRLSRGWREACCPDHSPGQCVEWQDTLHGLAGNPAFLS